MPREAAKAAIAQTKTLLSDTTNTVVYHKTQLCNRECIIAYKFRNDSLIEQHVAFALPNRRELFYYSTEEGYLAEYAKLRNLLREKYGTFVEDKKDLDIGDALTKWEKRRDQLAEAVAYEQQQASELQGRLNDEAALWDAKRRDSWPTSKTAVQLTRESQRFYNALEVRKKQQNELVAEAQKKLRKHDASKPAKTWESITSTFNAQDSDISLICSKTQAGISIVLLYKAKGVAPLLPSDL